jgi:dTDP-4-dehydrorhamnose reductase
VQSSQGLELWAGFECTVNRVGDIYIDQLRLTGHSERASDLELLPDLGVRAVRYPILWERTAPDGPEAADWRWSDERINRLRELGTRPIVGLVHHGSGPPFTNLIDPSFPELLAGYARAVAERYPWVEHYTPVNEPLTTARFSGLYGLWYPHGRDDVTFARALINQCRAVVHAMRAVRAVNPVAQLIQTEDLGKTHSTPLLAYQAEFENERRFLSFDLLSGRVERDHPLREYLRRAGVTDGELGWFLENACPPDILGINHYLSSERFLDERLERYPPASHGGNGRHAYADVLAAQVCASGPVGPLGLLEETWERYRRPIAVTEAHNGCTREEQLRWLVEVWEAALAVRKAGGDVRAVTAWSLLGSFGWDALVTRDRGRYEPGVYDLRAPRPRPTALAGLLRCLARGRPYSHPVLDTPGWWRRAERLHHPMVQCAQSEPAASGARSQTESGPLSLPVRKRGRSAPLAITGASGTLGRAFARLCELRGLPHLLLSRPDMDIAEPDSVNTALAAIEPWALVNAAGYVRVDDAQREPEPCRRENALGPAVLAAACAERAIPLVTFSSDLVFDGAAGRPYIEDDAVNPLNVYGATKVEAERAVLAALPSALVIRTSAFFGPWDIYNFVSVALRVLSDGDRFVAADDAVVSPTYVPDLVHACLDLLIDGEHGIWHLANRGALTWLELARAAAELAGVCSEQLVGQPTAAFNFSAKRPTYSVLGSGRGMLLSTIEEALERYILEREQR